MMRHEEEMIRLMHLARVRSETEGGQSHICAEADVLIEIIQDAMGQRSKHLARINSLRAIHEMCEGVGFRSVRATDCVRALVNGYKLLCMEAEGIQ